MSKFPEWAWKTLSVMVLPLIAWGIKLEVDRAVHTEQITQIQGNLTDHKTKLEGLVLQVQTVSTKLDRAGEDRTELKELKDAIIANGLEIAKLQSKMQTVVESLGQVRDELAKP